MELIKVALLRLDAVLSIFLNAFKPAAHKFGARRIRGLDALALTIGVISFVRAALDHRQRSLRLGLHAADFGNCMR
jgi:hypothetical protein